MDNKKHEWNQQMFMLICDKLFVSKKDRYYQDIIFDCDNISNLEIDIDKCKICFTYNGEKYILYLS